MATLSDTPALSGSFLFYLLAGASLPVLDFFSISYVLPTVRQALGADAIQSQFVVSAFGGAYATLLITGSRLGDLFGRRRLFVAGAWGFTGASVLAILAPTVNLLILARVFQGALAALFAPQVLATIQAVLAPAERSRAIRWLGTAYSLAGLFGMVLGGLLMAWHPWGLTWQLVFATYVPVGLVVAWGGRQAPESTNPHAQGLDFGGVGLLVVALVLLILPLAFGRAAGWPLWTLGLLALDPFIWAAFLGYEAWLGRQGRAPLVPLGLFHDGMFVRGLVLSVLLYLAYSFLFCFSLFVGSTGTRSTLDLGLALIPFSVAFFGVSWFVAPLTRWLGHRILAFGFGLMTLGWALMVASAFVPEGTGWWGFFGLVLVGLGNGIVQPSLVRTVTGAMEPRHAGVASGVLLSVQQMAGALGAVVLGGAYFGQLASGGTPAQAFATATGIAVVLGSGALGVALTFRKTGPMPTPDLSVPVDR